MSIITDLTEPMMPVVSYAATSLYRGKKACITSKGSRLCLSDKCLDSTWLAVHGMDSICMVTWRKDVDMTRVDPFYQHNCTNQQTMRSYATSVISEVECLPYDDTYNYNDDDLHLCVGDIIEKPFGVVSVVPETKKVNDESGHEASVYGYAVSTATMFLAAKMNSRLVFTIDETIQTAISAFQHMCLKELTAEDSCSSYHILLLELLTLLVRFFHLIPASSTSSIEFLAVPRPQAFGVADFACALPSLVSNKQAYLETLGYLCKEVPPVEQDKVVILTVVARHMFPNHTDNDVKLAANQELHNALGFTRAIFSDDKARTYIMRIVIQATIAPEVEIRKAAFECLVSISLKYRTMFSPYLLDISWSTNKAVREAVTKDEELVAIQALEFWSSMCRGIVNCGAKSEDSCFSFIKTHLSELVHMLFERRLMPLLIFFLCKKTFKKHIDKFRNMCFNE